MRHAYNPDTDVGAHFYRGWGEATCILDTCQIHEFASDKLEKDE